jgi:hypothetical protein
MQPFRLRSFLEQSDQLDGRVSYQMLAVSGSDVHTGSAPATNEPAAFSADLGNPVPLASLIPHGRSRALTRRAIPK